MFYDCLWFSAVLLGGFVFAALIHRTLLLLGMVFCALAGMVFVIILPVAGWHAFALVLAGMPAMFGRHWLSIGLALLATLGVYGVGIYQGLEYERGLKERYPLEPLVARLPHPPWRVESQAVDVEANLVAVEERAREANRKVEERPSPAHNALKWLHGETRGAFVDSPGFGMQRMRPSYYLQPAPQQSPEKPQVPQPSQEESPAWSPGNLPASAPEWYQAEWFSPGHRSRIADFAVPSDFVLVRDRKAWGFRPHALKEQGPVPTGLGLRLLSVDLVGLLVSEQPRVYVSKDLPRMKDLPQTPTRELDGFEQAGLKSLVAGELLFVREVDNDVRMLGAIHSASQCAACHGGQRGDLLGAFSYRLRRE